MDWGFANGLGNFLVLVPFGDYVVLLCHLKVNILNMHPICVHLFRDINIPLLISA